MIAPLDPSDRAEIGPLLRAYRAHLYETLPDIRDAIDEKYGDAVFGALLDGLFDYHAAPAGTILVARAAETDAIRGCVMVNPVPEVADAAEVQRLFVLPEAHGLGLGRALMEGAMSFARDAGYRRMVLDTGPGLLPAIALYKRLGFTPRGPYKPLPPGLAANALFFERALD